MGVRVVEVDDEVLVLEVGENRFHQVPFQAIASWGELLGIDDSGEVLEAILSVTERGSPGPDPVSGDNAWTPAYEALMLREQVGVQERIEGRPSMVAMAMFGESDSVALGRDQTRAMLGLPPLLGFQPVPLGRMMGVPTGDDGLGEARQVLADRVGLIARERAQFLARLAPDVSEGV